MPCANALSISFEDAERIKNQIGLQNMTGDERLEKAEEVIRETTAQLIVGIRNTLNLYDVDHAGGTISGVVLTGTGARLIGLPPVLASSINKVVRIGDPSSVSGFPKKWNGRTSWRTRSIWAQCLDW